MEAHVASVGVRVLLSLGWTAWTLSVVVAPEERSDPVGRLYNQELLSQVVKVGG